MITSFNTPVRELDGHIFVSVEELYKRDEIIEQLKKQLEEEKNAYNRMYNMYAEVKDKNERLNNIIKELEKFLIEEIEDYDKNINSRFITDIALLQYEGEKVCFEDMLGKLQELKGEDNE